MCSWQTLEKTVCHVHRHRPKAISEFTCPLSSFLCVTGNIFDKALCWLHENQNLLTYKFSQHVWHTSALWSNKVPLFMNSASWLVCLFSFFFFFWFSTPQADIDFVTCVFTFFSAELSLLCLWQQQKAVLIDECAAFCVQSFIVNCKCL